MLLLSYLLSALACTALYPATGTVSARGIERKHVEAVRREAVDRFGDRDLAVSFASVDDDQPFADVKDGEDVEDLEGETMDRFSKKGLAVSFASVDDDRPPADVKDGEDVEDLEQETVDRFGNRGLAVSFASVGNDQPYADMKERKHVEALKRESVDRFSKKGLAVSFASVGDDDKPYAGVKNFTFPNPAASAFYVDGKTIPDVDWDVGPSWAGLLPISGDKNETRKLFFWFFPPGPTGRDDSLTIWTNGGPGCSSLEGLLQENGPFSWSWGQYKPTVNKYSWTNLSSVLYIEQPVGTGYSQGTPNINNEDDLAAQFVGFLQQFLQVFPELKGKKTYLTGESYAGMYVPYIADYIYKKKAPLDLALQGIWLADPVLGWDVVQSQIPAVDFVHKYEHVFSLNQTFLKYLDKKNEECKYAGYLDKYLKYPPQGLLPLPGQNTTADQGCDLWTEIFNATLLVNPAFNVYRIFDVYPVLWDVLGFPGSFPDVQSPIYFDREDVKKAIHAPVNQTWVECSNINVFPNGDASLPPAFTVLPDVIEKSNRSVIIHGLADYILIAEGARLVFQNMTWGGKQGFQQAPKPDSFVVDGMGAMGTVQNERKLGYFEVVLSGHMVPQFSPKAAFQSMQWLFGIRENP